MKFFNYLITVAVVGQMALSLAASSFAQEKKPDIEKVVHWADAGSGTEIYLSENGRLTVISRKSVRVDYHTKINSSVSVDKRLTRVGSAGATVTYFAVNHHFSRTTIWMTLEFSIGGRKVAALTRTFYNSIFETVPTEQFFVGDSNLCL